MKKRFKEYHSYTEEQHVEMWDKCIFVFDANTLLNMYRYSRPTADAYFDALEAIGKKGQLWIPHQVGLEFYENRINVITEYEKSYDEILSILNKSKLDVRSKVKRHPFLDLGWIKIEMENGLSGIEARINQTKNSHPKWLENDDVLDKIVRLFDGNVGENYDEKKIQDISDKGKKRYEKKVPPGFKDERKTEERRYGDLILWFQIIDKAKECKRPVILVSDDTKEDWWLEKDGKRLMPLPALKKELHDTAGVSFYMYTSEKFLEHYRRNSAKVRNLTRSNMAINDEAIDEVREIRAMGDSRQHMELRCEVSSVHIEPGTVHFYLLELEHSLKKVRSLVYKRLADVVFREKVECAVNEIVDLRSYASHLSERRMEVQKMSFAIEEVFSYVRVLVVHGFVEQSLVGRLSEYQKRINYIMLKIHAKVLS